MCGVMTYYLEIQATLVKIHSWKVYTRLKFEPTFALKYGQLSQLSNGEEDGILGGRTAESGTAREGIGLKICDFFLPQKKDLGFYLQ